MDDHNLNIEVVEDKIAGKSLDGITLWAVWYADRFASGSDRDPASLVALFVDQTEAEKYIDSHEGLINVDLGKFDGLFAEVWPAKQLIDAKLVNELNVEKLLLQKPPARLRKHWEKGWIE